MPLTPYGLDVVCFKSLTFVVVDCSCRRAATACSTRRAAEGNASPIDDANDDAGNDDDDDGLEAVVVVKRPGPGL